MSFASFWELSIKASIGKITLEKTLTEFETYLHKHQFKILNFSFEYLEALQQLELFHQDPFDRMIIAQAISEDMTIITNDSKFKHYPVKLLMN